MQQLNMSRERTFALYVKRALNLILGRNLKINPNGLNQKMNNR